MTTMGDVGEFGFIERVRAITGSAPHVLEGIGDDCAVIQSGNRVLLMTADLSIQDVHFRLDRSSPGDIGWKAATSSLSDIAAMGGIPQTVIVSVAAPKDFEAETLESIMQGIVSASQAEGAVVVGGDTTRSTTGLLLDVTLIGEAPEGRYLTRAGAKTGDHLVVTGYPARSACGLHAQENGHEEFALIASHQRPSARCSAGRWLNNQPGVHALIDLSDGLLQDVGHISAKSGTGLSITSAALPIDPETQHYCQRNDLDPIDMTLTGGESYELAFAVAPDAVKSVLAGLSAVSECEVTDIGIFTKTHGSLLVDDTERQPAGFDHFAQQ